MTTLQTAHLRELNNHQQFILAMTNRGPVALVEEQSVAGVLVSPAQWEAIAKTLEAAQECLDALDASEHVARNDM